MEIETLQNKIIITENIKTVADFQQIKTAVDAVIAKSKYIIIEIVDSISITSSVIGYFNMIVHVKNVDLNMHIKNPKLIVLLEDLSLIKTFKAKQI